MKQNQTNDTPPKNREEKINAIIKMIMEMSDDEIELFILQADRALSDRRSETTNQPYRHPHRGFG